MEKAREHCELGQVISSAGDDASDSAEMANGEPVPDRSQRMSQRRQVSQYDDDKGYEYP